MTRMTRRDTFRRAADDIQRLAAHSFCGHTAAVLERCDRSAVWRCGKAGSSLYAFHVAVLPGRIFEWGDVGELSLATHKADVDGSLRWFSPDIGRDYALGRVTGECRHLAFYQGDAERILREHRHHLTRDHFDELLAGLREGELYSQDTFASALYAVASDIDICDLESAAKPSPETLWGWEAVRWWRKAIR